MSVQLINQYYSKLDRIIQYGGSRNETAIRQAFYALLNDYAHKRNLELVTEIPCRGTKGKDVYPDGILKNALRLDYGYWESKDESDDIEEEIRKKLNKGYPTTNILFEDSQTAVLYQSGFEAARIDMKDAVALDRILNAFINYEQPAVHNFNEALEKFKADIPTIIETLRLTIEKAVKENGEFVKARDTFFELCKHEINPDITPADIREMIIQHILTEDIFNTIFDESHFHRENNIARELEKVIATFFTGATRRNTLGVIEHYYQAINAAAASIADHHEKQKFLKIIYENFYKAYNPKGADRLGIVYTPNEIVRFMIESADYLLHKHFGRTLADKNVEILDPATGTGTFICDIIEYIPNQHLQYKYQNEIHANEVAILPYYIANLNIEFTYKQKMGAYEEFKNICFVDTLDNTSALKWERMSKDQAPQVDMFGISSENTARIKRQNERKISVIIGNPPYNANQKNENENNKNREYPMIDKRIKETYIKHSTAQKTKVYDMYSRFYRWAMDRIDENGIIALVTNRSFVESRTFDGFRKCVEDDFTHCYIVDTKSDVRANPKIAGTTHNVFGIQTGVAIMFLVRNDKKKEKLSKCRIEYAVMEDEWRKEEKLDWLKNNALKSIPFNHVIPDKNHNWLELTDNDFDELLPIADKNVKFGKSKGALFELFSLGIATNRDEWVYDFQEENLIKKIQFFYKIYAHEKERWGKSNKKEAVNDFVDRTIKWTEELENHLLKGSKLIFSKKYLRTSCYRPFTKQHVYFDRIIVHRPYQQDVIFPIEKPDDNVMICLSGQSANKAFQCLATNKVGGLDFLEKTQCLPLYRYDEKGQQVDNITDWGLDQFRNHYKDKKISREDIFHYVYAVLHDPAYRKKYELNLKREFPRIPFYQDFLKWEKWGKKLMVLHIGYESVKPYGLKRVEPPLDPLLSKEGKHKEGKAKLKTDKENGLIILDEKTTLSGVPKEAWEYKLGNRSALEWILDQYKEKKPSDPTIAEKFNTYKFADYKEHVIDLLQRVCTVSVETVKIVGEMGK